MQKHGFTLIEMVIVVTIVAVSVGLILPHYQQFKQKEKGLANKGSQINDAPSLPDTPRELKQICKATVVEDVTHDGCDYIFMTNFSGAIALVHKGNCRACTATAAVNLPAEQIGGE